MDTKLDTDLRPLIRTLYFAQVQKKPDAEVNRQLESLRARHGIPSNLWLPLVGAYVEAMGYEYNNPESFEPSHATFKALAAAYNAVTPAPADLDL
jgi:hypothetical protein